MLNLSVLLRHFIIMNPAGQNHHHTDDEDYGSYYREDTERASTKASLFRNAQHFNVTGGRTSVVGRNQTIGNS